MNRKPLLTIFLIVFIDLFGFGLVLPLLPFIAEQYHASASQIGFLTASYSFFQFIAAPLLGRWSDRYGRKRLLLFSQLGTFVGFVLLGLSHSLLLLFISRIIDGITGGNISIAQAYVADVTKPSERAKGMGLLGAAFGLGFILGPGIGGFLSRFGFAVPAFFAAGISLLTALATLVFLKETVNVAQAAASPRTTFSWSNFWSVFKTQPLGLLIGIFFLLNVAFSAMQGTFALWTSYTYRWSAQQNGYLFAYIGLMAVLIQLKVLGALTARFPERAIFRASIPLLAVGIWLIPSAHPWYWLLPALTFIAAGNGLANPTLQAIASETVAPAEYGEVLGLIQAAGSLGRIGGPIMGGELFDHGSPNAPFVTGGVLLLITTLIAWRYLPNKPKAQSTTDSF